MSVHQKQINAYECTTCGALYATEETAHRCSRLHRLHADLVALRAGSDFDTSDYLDARARVWAEVLDCYPSSLDCIWPPRPSDAPPKEGR